MIKKVDLILPEGMNRAIYSGFVGASLILVSREGRVCTRASGAFSGKPEFTFKTTGNLAPFKWQIVFNEAANPGGEKISVIYKL